ncbi:DUF421 domain-containing protein [Hasllibacter sp. MH4015]|uniref:DUF421 domain-containing protein n=1 Tax=Hasllibacter sp. MH4015 TaxID=2854029 RepID=UPI001CD5B8B1|nr:YetF domain-containing protein [Hasllibacter sp. MH4015]
MTILPESWSDLWQAMVGGILAYGAILIAVRLVGLRSFAKMVPHDFAVTVAIGSVLASAAMANSTPLLIPLAAIAVLFGLQWVMSLLIARSDRFERLVINDPVLLMDGSNILPENLKRTKVSESDLHVKLRETNVTQFDQVLAVVFETTGDISVLHDDRSDTLDERLLAGVQRSENERGH